MQALAELFQTRMIEIIFFILGGGLLWIFIKFNNRPADQEPSPDLIRLPYEKGKTLLTDTEQKFYHELETVVGDQYTIFSKVRIFDFIDVKKGMAASDQIIFEHKIKLESVNFLLCTPMNTKIAVAIELDNITDSSANKTERDEFVSKVFKDSNFPLLRFKVRGSYSSEIKKQLEETINFKEESEES